MQLFSPEYVCKTDWNWNNEKCLRQFNTIWSLLMIKKISIMIFIPFINIFKTILINKFKKWRNYKKNNSNNFESNTEYVYNIKSDYNHTINEIELMILFGFITPFIIALILLSISIKIIIYKLILNKYNWKIKPIDKLIYIPINYLYFSLIVNQIYMLISLISYTNTTNNSIINGSFILLLIGFILIQIVNILMIIRFKRIKKIKRINDTIKSETDMETVISETATIQHRQTTVDY